MTFAVIQTGGKQYKVSKDSEIWVEKLSGEPGDEIVFDKVLMVSDGDKVEMGSKVSAKVTGQVLSQGKRKKILVFKQRRRKRYRRRHGHRQQFTAVKITDIAVN